jgi:hypothetical protein
MYSGIFTNNISMSSFGPPEPWQKQIVSRLEACMEDVPVTRAGLSWNSGWSGGATLAYRTGWAKLWHQHYPSNSHMHLWLTVRAAPNLHRTRSYGAGFRAIWSPSSINRLDVDRRRCAIERTCVDKERGHLLVVNTHHGEERNGTSGIVPRG